MSNLERNAIFTLKYIREIAIDLLEGKTDITDTQVIINQCDNIINEYEARKKRLGEKENLSKDTK